ncbi:MAG: hypothetical protein ACOY6N_13915 [Pseudomonadota bacterium]
MKLNDSGIPAALAAAVLFGAGTPLAKLLLEHAGPWYGCYPLIRGATAVVLFGELATGRPSFPTELLTVIVALACAALLEGGRPFHSPLSQ